MVIEESKIHVGNPIERLSDRAKTWVYTSNSKFTSVEINEIIGLSEAFLSQWESHGKLLLGSIQLINNQFIVIFADSQDEAMCGRAQDASVRFIKELEVITEKTLMDRMLVAYEVNYEIQVTHFNQLKELVENGEVSKNTFFYNSLIATKKEFETNWKTPILNSWLDGKF